MRKLRVTIILLCAIAISNDGHGMVAGSGIDDSALNGNTAYQRWKAVFLGTISGRALWQKYNSDQDFRLVITMGENPDQGAITKDFVFNRFDKLVGATIVLGPSFAKNAPTRAATYPVTRYTEEVTREIRAAALLAHEFGHVEHARGIDGRTFQRQQALLNQNEAGFFRYGQNWFSKPEYQLIVSQLGTRPTDVMRQRELIAEGAAVQFLQDHFGPHGPKMPPAIRQAIKAYMAAPI